MKVALIIGINYKGTDFELNGCRRDAQTMRELLITLFGYKKENITVLDEETPLLRPTRVNILRHLKILIDMPNVSHIFFHYSGHGSNIKDTSGDESDGMDECIVPCDWPKVNMIVDDELNALFQTLRSKTQVTCVMDCCHSGTVLDLIYKFDAQQNMFVPTERPQPLQPLIISFSGCRDEQTSADAFIDGKFQGALTALLAQVLRETKGDISWAELMQRVNELLAAKRYSQRCVLCSSKMVLAHNKINF